MTYINKLNSFDEVAEAYTKTKPVLSKQHTVEQDIRPIGKRARKWERIIKVNDYCYALSCGGYADPVFAWGGTDEMRKAYPLTGKEIALCAPIVWCKHKDGSETITVRNGPGDWQHNNVYSFLARALPRELWFRQTREGLQYIYNRSAGQTLHLPKTRSGPRHIIEHWKDQAKKGGVSHWAVKYLKAFQTGDDGLSVTLKRETDGCFTLVGEPQKVMVNKTLVNKDEKREFKEHIETLYQWCLTMYPLLRSQFDWAYRNELSKQLMELAKEHKINGYRNSWRELFKHSEAGLVRAILKDPEHVMRYGLGVAGIDAIINANSNCREEDAGLQAKYIRASFNRWINKVGGFATKVKAEK